MNREVLGGRNHQSRKTNSGDAQTRKHKQKNQASNCDARTEEAQLQQRTRALSCSRARNLPKTGSQTSNLDEENHKCTEKKMNNTKDATQVFQLKSKQDLHPTHGGHHPPFLI
jgi:hypothetical protein